jgi:hypothetical protein
MQRKGLWRPNAVGGPWPRGTDCASARGMDALIPSERIAFEPNLVGTFRTTLGLQAGALSLKVTDNGAGVTREKASARCSLGLMGNRERATQWQRQVEVTGATGSGTAVLLSASIARRKLEAGP